MSSPREAPVAPPVVAVLVAHRPGEWFGEVLDGLASQDYPNLQTLILATGAPDEVAELAERVNERLPGAFVRSVGGNPGFGRAANEVLRLVEGQSGFFCVMHDDVALDPPAIGLLVEELYRSNAGIVGPKLVDWDDPAVLQHVGLAVDHHAAVDTLIEPGERDQEQHDAVTDVFAVPSACLMVRADLFRSLGGFDSELEYHGEDIDLCWRAHLSGARVIVVPAARGRHREELEERRPDIDHRAMRARHRMRAFATLTGRWRTLVRLPLLIIRSIAELVVGVFSGRSAEGRATVAALFGLIPSLGSIIARRRAIRPLRLVPDHEITDLQLRGSSRRAAHRRSVETSGGSPFGASVSDWGGRVEGSAAVVSAWIALIVLLLFGSRAIISNGSFSVGEMLPYPESLGSLLETYRSGWWESGLGATAAHPTGLALIALVAPFVAGQMGLLHTVGIVGVVLLGYVGMWRLVSVLGSSRLRMVAVVVYAAVPLPYAAIGAGRWSVVGAYAAVPWALHAIRRISGWVVPGRVVATDETSDLVALPDTAERLRVAAGLVLVLAVSLALSPGAVVVVVMSTLVWLISTALVRGSIGAAAVGVAASVVGAVGALVLNLPWSASLLGGDGWNDVVGVETGTPRDLGLSGLARFEIGPAPLSVLTLGLFVAAVSAVLLVRGWRLSWAARGAGLTVAFLAIALLDDRGSLPFRLPESGVLLVPVAVGLAITAACAVAALADVRDAKFGVAQPLALLGVAAIVVGVLPGLASVLDGRYDQPELTIALQVDSILPADPPEGDHRILYLGDPRVMPVAARSAGDGIAYALLDDGALSVNDDWANESAVQKRLIDDALAAIATADTARVGRVLAPLAVRYIVIPVTDSVSSTPDDPIAVPSGLISSLDAQLDLRRVYSPRDLVVFENTAWIPVRSMLTTEAATASEQAGIGALARSDLAGATPVMVGATSLDAATDDLPAGVFHLASPADDHWQLSADGEKIEARPAFGYSSAYVIADATPAVLEYETSWTRTLWLMLQVVLWAVTLLGTTRVLSDIRRRRVLPLGAADAVIHLDDDTEATVDALSMGGAIGSDVGMGTGTGTATGTGDDTESA